jgi:molybdenum cofactor synthesis domain-containing protein
MQLTEQRADPERAFRVALIVLSDKAASGERLDACLPVMRESLPPHCLVAAEHILSDDRKSLEALLKLLSDRDCVDGVFTSGGTGLGPRDFTPQATLAVAHYEVPGIADAMRNLSAREVPTAILSRAVAAVRNRTLIVNLPGSPKAVRETMRIIAPVLPHAFRVLRGGVGDHVASGL